MHKTKINAIFVDVKTGDGSLSVHKTVFDISSNLIKCDNEHVGGGSKITSALIIYYAGVKTDSFLYLFVCKNYDGTKIQCSK